MTTIDIHSVLKFRTKHHTSMSLSNTLCKDLLCREEKACDPLALIACWPYIGSNNLDQTFPVIVDQTWTSIRSKFWPLLFAKWFQFWNNPLAYGLNRSAEVIPKLINPSYHRKSMVSHPFFQLFKQILYKSVKLSSPKTRSLLGLLQGNNF